MAVPDKNKIINLREVVFNHLYSEIVFKMEDKHYELTLENDEEILREFRSELIKVLTETTKETLYQVMIKSYQDNDEIVLIQYKDLSKVDMICFLKHLHQQVNVILSEFKEMKSGNIPSHLYTH